MGRVAGMTALVALAAIAPAAVPAAAVDAPITVRLDPTVGIRAVDASVHRVGENEIELRADITETARAGTSDLWLLLSNGDAGLVVNERSVRRRGSAGILTAPPTRRSPMLLRITGQETTRMYTGTSTVRARIEWPTSVPADGRAVFVTLVQ